MTFFKAVEGKETRRNSMNFFEHVQISQLHPVFFLLQFYLIDAYFEVKLKCIS